MTEPDPLQPLIDRLDGKPYYMISCPTGWTELVLELDRKLAEIDPDYIIDQVKEKFASLRFYCRGRDFGQDSVARKLIQKTESKSSRTCETCGKPGKLCEGKWDRTLCNDCVK